MIPKIIHYCWISDDQKPDKIKKCMESWLQKLNGYTFINWNKSMWEKENITCRWLEDAYRLRKYAFCADFLRVASVYKYGGFYLDCDVMIYKPLDDLLQLKYFLSLETIENRGYIYPQKYSQQNYHYPEAAVFGSESKNKIFENILQWYYAQNNYHMHGIPTIMKDSWINSYNLKFGHRDINESIKHQNTESDIIFMDQNYFSYDKQENETAYYKHMFTNTWC